MHFSLSEVDRSWVPFFKRHEDLLNEILHSLEGEEIAPARQNIFRAFRTSVDSIRVLILGQDPYPGVEVADGLAFSTLAHNPIPASLRNIFKEYCSDLALEVPASGDLSPWADNGVLLLNRTLTTSVRERNAHLSSDWKMFTYEVALELSRRNVVAILWGNNARELAPLFLHRIESAHPSPLSARRGFFGSRPFSRANEMLVEFNREPIDWKL